MLRVATDALRPGMRVGKSVISADGVTLLRAGISLRSSYIAQLKRLGIGAVYIQNELAPDVQPPDIVSPETQVRLNAELKQAMADLRQTLEQKGARRVSMWQAANMSRLRSAVSQLIDEVIANRAVLVNVQDIRTADDYTYGHSVNVCMLAAVMGAGLSYDHGRLRDLAAGCLLHDIGKVTIDPAILNKAGPLTEGEEQEMRKHPERGFQILSRQEGLSLVSAHVAWQHHERWDGSGYPRRLRGADILEYARVCAIADVYDALVADRAYRRGLSPGRALRIVTEGSAGFFDPNLLAVFAEHIAIYPVGSLVELSSGEVAVVVEVRRGQRERPRVRVLLDPLGQRLSSPYEIELADRHDLDIARAIEEELALTPAG